MLKGYYGKILRVDLDTEKITTEKIDKEVLKKYIGGSGLAGKYLYEETGPETDPLGPENRLIFMTGPFTGTVVPTSGRHAVVTKSPLTGIWAESDAGGHWGTALKSTGYDGIIIKGKAKKPTYLQLSNNEFKLCDASHVWGKDSFETYYILKNVSNNSTKTDTIPFSSTTKDALEKLKPSDKQAIGKDFGEVLSLRWYLTQPYSEGWTRFGFETGSNAALVDYYVYRKVK